MSERGIRCILAPRRLDVSLSEALPGALLGAVFCTDRSGPVALAHGMTLELRGVRWTISKDGKTLAAGDELLSLLATAYATTEGTIGAIAFAPLFGVTFDTRTSQRLARVIDTWAKMGRPSAARQGSPTAPVAAAEDAAPAPSLSPAMQDLMRHLASVVAPNEPALAPADGGGA